RDVDIIPFKPEIDLFSIYEYQSFLESRLWPKTEESTCISRCTAFFPKKKPVSINNLKKFICIYI
ncbi:MAG: hypothetical protein ACTSRA_17820, partial [Promethearchaeota archaeon]